MKSVAKSWRLLAAGLACLTAAWAEPLGVLGHVEGRVLLRLPAVKQLDPVAAGLNLSANETLISGDASRFEVRPSAGDGVWRVGRRAIFALQDGGARLLAGTALVQVPPQGRWTVDSTRSRVVLPEGTWLVQAVDNRGLKIICLDGDEPVEARGLPSAPADAVVASVRLRPGEMAFLQPGGKTFSPLVVIFLQEVLATSRLVGGFPEPVPGMKRLVNQAIAQRERLKGVTNAVVVGAPEAGGFQIAVPKTETEAGR